MYWRCCVRSNAVFRSKTQIHLPVVAIELALDSIFHMLRWCSHQIWPLCNETKMYACVGERINILPSDGILGLFLDQSNPFQDICDIVDAPFLFGRQRISHLRKVQCLDRLPWHVQVAYMLQIHDPRFRFPQKWHKTTGQCSETFFLSRITKSSFGRCASRWTAAGHACCIRTRIIIVAVSDQKWTRRCACRRQFRRRSSSRQWCPSHGKQVLTQIWSVPGDFPLTRIELQLQHSTCHAKHSFRFSSVTATNPGHFSNGTSMHLIVQIRIGGWTGHVWTVRKNKIKQVEKKTIEEHR